MERSSKLEPTAAAAGTKNCCLGDSDRNRKRIGKSGPFSLPPASDLPLLAEPDREPGWQWENGKRRDPASALQNRAEVGDFAGEEQFLHNQPS